MNTHAPGLLLAALGLTLLLTGLSLFLLRDRRLADDRLGTATRFCLVALRLAIGWHFLVEGLDKLGAGAWSSEAYLRESTGPLAPAFRDLAGDRLLDKLTLTRDGSFPAELAVEWDAYLDAFNAHYNLDASQAARAKTKLQQIEDDLAKRWLYAQPRLVDRPSPDPSQPPIKVAMTMPERLKYHEFLEAQLREVEDVQRPGYGPQSFDKLRHAKANLNKWRAAMQRDLALMNREMQGSLRALLLEFADDSLSADARKKIAQAHKTVKADSDKERADPEDWAEVARLRDKWDDKMVVAYRGIFDDMRRHDANAFAGLDKLSLRVIDNIIDKKSKDLDPYDPLPYRVGRPVSHWALLDWSDLFVKWGITIVGVCLLAGFLTRLACIAGAGFLLMFFLAMPPLPGWPDSPRAEGHYLFINKNIIEMLALLALATTRSGRWVGLDGLLQFLCPRAWKKSAPSANLDIPARPAEEATVRILPPA